MSRLSRNGFKKLLEKKPALLPEQAGSSLPSFNKYKTAAKEDRTWNGIVFDSKLEMRIYKHLTTLVSPERIQRQVPYELVPKQVGPSGKKYLPVRYVADLVVDGKHFLEIKGMVLPEFVIKQKLLLQVHGVELVVVKNLKDLNAWYTSINHQTAFNQRTK